jgi:hypothetical protein
MIQATNIDHIMALWLIEPTITYTINHPIADTLARITNDAGQGDITEQDCIGAIVGAIVTEDADFLDGILRLESITHDGTATADATTIGDNGMDVATIDPDLTNNYHALCYLDGELEDTFPNQTGAFEFATLDAGSWRIVFIDATNYETSEITITATEA